MRIHEKIGGAVSLEDLVSSGAIGLINAVDSFDPKFNVKLKTYAEHRIRGAILDSIRGLDGVPAHKRKWLKHIEAAIAAAEQRLQRVPTEEEIAQRAATFRWPNIRTAGRAARHQSRESGRSSRRLLRKQAAAIRRSGRRESASQNPGTRRTGKPAARRGEQDASAGADHLDAVLQGRTEPAARSPRLWGFTPRASAS